MAMPERTMAVGFGDRVEALVCNYGPLDRNTSRELYEDGVPALCPSGTTRSSRYRALCRKCFPPRNVPSLPFFLSLYALHCLLTIPFDDIDNFFIGCTGSEGCIGCRTKKS